MTDTKKKLHVVFASSEAAPFVKTGGLGDVAGSLPAALQKAGADVIVMVPLYGTIPERYKQQMEHMTDFYVSLGWRNEYCGLERLEHNGVTYVFIDNKRYFDRDYPYGFFDDGERFAFFSKAICESLQHLPEGFAPDILHCNDWHTALAPVFLREFYQGLPLYENVKTIFSIHNIAFQGQFSATVLEDVCGLAHIPAAAFQLTCGPDAINFMQGALNYCDAITTVSPTYAGEIQTPAFGEGLDGVLRRRRESLQGIVNGIDVDHFNPATDPAIAQNFDIADRTGKAVCKARLQEELGLTVRDDQPLMTMVTRLTRQKGMDLVTYALDRILSGGVQVAVLGTGDPEYENALRYFASKYPGQMAARIQFDPALSQRMYAGSDLFLMPSLFEPCGLSQMIAMRYGTLPVVRETGGLKDTVVPYNYVSGEGTGFSFANFNGEEMGDAVFRGARLFWDDREAWDRLVTQAMASDFSWTASAAKYMDLYHWMHPEIPRQGDASAEAEPKTEIAPEPRKKATTRRAPARKPAAKATTGRAATKVTATEDKSAAAKASTKKAASAKSTASKRTATKPAGTRSASRATAGKSTLNDETAAKSATSTKPATKPTSTKPAAKSATTKAKATAEKAAAAEKQDSPSTSVKKASPKKAASTKAPAAPAATAGRTADDIAKEPAAKQPAKTVSQAKKTTRRR